MKEIVAAQIGTRITNSLQALRDASLQGKDFRLMTRQEAQFMAACDLGINWERLANGETMFFIDENGNPSWTAQ